MSYPLFLGFTDDRERPTDTTRANPTVRVNLSEEERATGLHVIGAPGTGKSKFLEHLIRQDIREGRGLCLIDPHGELYDNVLAWSAYAWPDREIIPLNLSTATQVIGFNPLARSIGDVHAQVNRCIEATVKAWGVRDTDETPTLERILRCVFHALIENGLTLSEARHLLVFHEPTVRDYLTSQITEEAIREEWRELAALKTPREWRDEVRSTKNKLLRFLTARSALRFLSLTDAMSLDLGAVMDRSAVLLVNLRLDQHTLDAMDARWFGSLLVSKLFDLARLRGGFGQAAPAPFSIYCDEFQNFVSPDVAEILPQGRKFGLSLVLAHQFLTQLEAEDTRLVEAVMAACRTKVVFGGLSPKDAAAMVPALFPGQIDYHEVKRIEYNVEFWPRYGRETTHAHATTKGRSQGTSHTVGRSHTDGTSYTSGDNWGSSCMRGESVSHPDGGSGLDGTHTASSASTNSTGGMNSYGETSADTTSTADTYSESTSEAESDAAGDIPFYYYDRQEVPEKEYWGLEEQEQRLAAVLMLQLQRHCFVKPPSGPTLPVLVPRVPSYAIGPEQVADYEATTLSQAGALSPAQVDELTQERTRQLEQAAKDFFDGQAIPPLHLEEAPISPPEDDELITIKPKSTKPFSKPGRKPGQKPAVQVEPE